METKGLSAAYLDVTECFIKLQHHISYFLPPFYVFPPFLPSFLSHMLSSALLCTYYYLQMLE